MDVVREDMKLAGVRGEDKDEDRGAPEGKPLQQKTKTEAK